MDRKLSVGILGMGNMGVGHARGLVEGKCPELKLVAVAEADPGRLAWARENLCPDAKGFSDALEMLDSGLIEA